nr:retrovirus-related Pol polyprotein from transposon TNT 1-94 [Tanacetum cinerariifolium]
EDQTVICNKARLVAKGYAQEQDYPLEQVRGNPTRPVQTRRQLATDPEMCMYALTSKGYLVYNKKTRIIVDSIYIRFDEIKEVKETSVANNTSGLVPQQQKASDYDNPGLVLQRQDVSSSADEQYHHNKSWIFYLVLCMMKFSMQTKDYPLEQVRGNPTRPVQTRRQLGTDPEMCMYALTVSTAERKNIKEETADSAWIEAMQEELHQFDRL